MIEDDQFGAGGGRFRRKFLNLALTDQRGRFRSRPRLDRATDYRRAGADRQLFQLIERFLRVDRGGQGCAPPGSGTAGPFDANQNGAFAGKVRLGRAYASGES